jgi:dephospho-CoA kinase
VIRVGLTGSIGMGKSTVLAMFADLGAATWDADAAVHRLYAKGGAAVAPIRELFAEAVKEGAVDRAALAMIVLGDTAALRKLEDVVHPLVARDRESFMENAALAGADAVVLDIPLLFENGAEKFFDATVVVSAPQEVQRARVLARPGMIADKFEAIRGLQLPDADKRQRADYVIDTGTTLDETRAEVAAAYEDILRKYAPL